MSAPSEGEVPVWYYDGQSALRRSPALVPAGAAFDLIYDDGRRDGPYAFADLVRHAPFEGHLQFGLKDRPGWRIGIPDPEARALSDRLPHAKRYGGLIDRIGILPAAIGFAVVSALALVGLSFAPQVVAGMVPRSAEARIGDLMVGDLGNRACVTPAGDSALRALTTRMGVASDVDVRVVNVPMVNAVTLPGGHVVVFSGLLDEAESADEVAGVLAHEIGHVENRDVLESLIRQLGLSVVLGGLDGNVGGYTNALLSASYSRKAESRADDYAIAALRKSNVAPGPTASFFHRLSKMEVNVKGAGAALGYFSSHPLSADRERRFAASAEKRAYAPSLDAKQWQSLKTICAGKGAPDWDWSL